MGKFVDHPASLKLPCWKKKMNTFINRIRTSISCTKDHRVKETTWTLFYFFLIRRPGGGVFINIMNKGYMYVPVKYIQLCKVYWNVVLIIWKKNVSFHSFLAIHMNLIQCHLVCARRCVFKIFGIGHKNTDNREKDIQCIFGTLIYF